MSTWTTQDGRVLDIRWMDSKHLVNSFNMQARRFNLREDTMYSMSTAITPLMQNFIAMRDEIKARGLLLPNGSKQQPVQLLTIDVPREDHKQLCMLRAILDAPPKNVEEIVELFHRNPNSYIEHVLTCADPKWWPVQEKFTEYRLAPKVNP